MRKIVAEKAGNRGARRGRFAVDLRVGTRHQLVDVAGGAVRWKVSARNGQVRRGPTIESGHLVKLIQGQARPSRARSAKQRMKPLPAGSTVGNETFNHAQ